jgi:hypothetical protein
MNQKIASELVEMAERLSAAEDATDYTVLPEALLSALAGMVVLKIDRELHGWDFPSSVKVSPRISVGGKKIVYTIDTPEGKKKVEVKAKLIR